MENHNPTKTIKCTFSNRVHRLLDKNFGVKRDLRWKKQYRDKEIFTNEEKIKLFDEILKIDKETSNLIANFQYQRREKRRVEKLRDENGYYKKKEQKKLNKLVV